MITADFAPQRRKLLALRARLRGITTQMADNALVEANTTRMPNHMAELGSGNFEQELTLSLLGSERTALDQIDAALARTENGSYGRCETCGGRIPKSRLQAIPYVAQCVRCASEEESEPFGRPAPRRVLPR